MTHQCLDPLGDHVAERRELAGVFGPAPGHRIAACVTREHCGYRWYERLYFRVFGVWPGAVVERRLAALAADERAAGLGSDQR